MTAGLWFGVDLCLDDPGLLPDGPFALLTNQASTDARTQSPIAALQRAAAGRLTRLFTPQHGMWGTEQANMIETPHADESPWGLPLWSLYSNIRQPTESMLEGLDAVVIDLQDVGTRVYTFMWSAVECLKAAARCNLRVVVLDRPNPIGGNVEGPLLDQTFSSFVGGWPLPMRHGLTIGEVLSLVNDLSRIGAELSLVPCVGWSRADGFGQSGRQWVAPSPNLSSLASCLTYPGQVLFEGTNISEGRGTTSPFQVVGAPYIRAHEALMAMLEGLKLPGILFRPTRFRPTFDKWANEVCDGVALHVTDAAAFRPYETGIALLAAIRLLWPEGFRWLDPPYEYEATHMPIDIISGSDRLRRELDGLTALSNEWLRDMSAVDGSWADTAAPFLNYS